MKSRKVCFERYSFIRKFHSNGVPPCAQMMEAQRLVETSWTTYQYTRRHIAEVSHLHNPHLESHKFQFFNASTLDKGRVIPLLN
jgi:hypothetical protein